MPLLESNQEFNLKLLINTRRHLLLAMVLILGSVSLLFLAIRPQIVTLFELKDQLSAQRQYFQNLTQKLNDLNQIQVSDEFEKSDKVNEVLPSHKPILELLTNLSQASNQNEIDISELQVSPGEISTDSTQTTSQPNTKSTKNFSALKLMLTAEGKTNDVDDFMEVVERIAPFTSIVELSLTGQQSEAEEGQDADDQYTKAEMTLETYYYTGTIKTRLETQLPSVKEEEMRVFDTVQQFRPTDFKPPSEINSTDIEDLFGIEGFDFNFNAD